MLMDNDLVQRLIELGRDTYPDYKFIGHIIPVMNNSLQIALHIADEKINLNLLKSGACMHDIGKEKFFKKYHHFSGALYCIMALPRLDIDFSDVKSIAHIVMNHGYYGKPISIEATIVRNADAVSHFTESDYLLWARKKYNNCTMEDALKWYYPKLRNDLAFKITINKALEMVKETSAYRGLMEHEY
jgi:hypothetical protein